MSDEPPASRPRRTRLARTLLVGVAIFLVLCGVGALAVPLLIEHVAFARLGESIGRQVSAERIRFNPFTLALSARGVRVSNAQTGIDFVTIDDVRADLSMSSLRHLAPVVDGLTIDRPVISLQRSADGRFNFSDILEQLKAAPADPEAEGATTGFAIHNLEVRGGEIGLDDQVLQQQHRVADLRIGVPFISNLAYAAAITVQPSLSALVNDSPLQMAGATLPFSETRETTVDAAFKDLDVNTYLRLSPVPLAFSVPEGKLSADLKIHFAQEAGVNELSISGSSRLDGLRVDARDGSRLASAPRLVLGLERIEPLAGHYEFGDLDIEGLDLAVERRADGGFPLLHALTLPPQEQTRKAPPQVQGEDGIRWSIRKTSLRDGRFGYRDGTVKPSVELVHSNVSLELGTIGNRLAQGAAGRMSLRQNESSHLSWTGELDLTRSRAAGRVDASVVTITPYLPYLDGAFNGRLATGALQAQGDVNLDWAKEFQLQVSDARASVENARLTLPGQGVPRQAGSAEAKSAGAKPAVAAGRLAAEGIAVSLAGRQAAVARLEIDSAEVQVERDAAGNLNLRRINPAMGASLRASPADADDATAEANRKPGATPAGQSPAPWTLELARIDLARNQVFFRDLSSPQPVDLAITEIAGSVEQVGTDLARTSRFDLTASTGSNGRVAARGDFVVAPWSMQAALKLQGIALAAFDPYLTRVSTLSIDEGALSTSGQLQLAPGRVRYSGMLGVDGLRTRERITSVQTIRWRELLLDGIDIDVNPESRQAQDRIVVGAITLREFFARVLLSEQGRFNLQDIVRTEASAEAQAQAQARSQAQDTGRSGGGVATGAVEADEGLPPGPAAPVEHARPSPGTPAAPAGPSSAAGPIIRLGTITLERGSSNFTDRFVEPDFSVNLTDLNGSLSAVASDNPMPADLTLTGRVDGNAPIEISGSINPLAATLTADIRAQAKGIDLPTLTPYAAKYAGYAIEKGKLSLDVRYRIENDRLESQNRIILDQLTLGEKVESPDATSLPIQFALGLLKNSNGEIDVSLPVSGSLDDPQFSIAGVIGRAIVNLLTRAVTSPFSLLASALGSSAQELSFVEFQPGTAILTKESLSRLQTMSKVLKERPALKLEIAGRVDPKGEKDAIERQRLEARLKALKRRHSIGGDAVARQEREDERNRQDDQSHKQSPLQAGTQAARDQQDRRAQLRQSQTRQEDAAVSAGVTISPDEYPQLLKQLYDDTALPDKPRNASGVVSPLEVPEMEKLLLAAIAVDPEAARRLAGRRSQVVRQWLSTQGKVAEERMFVLAPRLDPGTRGPNQSQPQCPASCAEFSLR